MLKPKYALLAGFVVLALQAGPAFAGHDNSNCFSAKTSSGFIKLCTGDERNYGWNDSRDDRKDKHHDYRNDRRQQVVHHYYYGPPHWYKPYGWHKAHYRDHDKKDSHKHHFRHGHGRHHNHNHGHDRRF